MGHSIGEKLKYLRNKYTLTQAEVAEGICSQAMISKIEKHEELYPSAHLLYELSKKLGVPIGYFFSDDFNAANYVQITIEEICRHTEEKDFFTAYELIKLEKRNPNFKNNDAAMSYLLWQEAICISEITNNHRLSIKIIDNLFINKKFYSLEEINMLSSKITFLLRCEEIEEAYNLQIDILKRLNKLPFFNLHYSRFLIINIYFLCSQAAFYYGDIKKAISHCQEAIRICHKEQTYYKLAELKELEINIKNNSNGRKYYSSVECIPV
ncbi:Transcriptional regulator, XRE family [Bacillus sp. ZZV12-4809]|nr:Transcriptional regulator, XRE family [Bacillus sp. ZZV12-4809]